MEITALLLSLMIWTTSLLGIDKSNIPDPEIVRYTNNIPDILEDISPGTIGMYFRDRQLIGIRGDLDLEGPYGQSVFVHEYVHHIQNVKDIYSGRSNCREAAAYKIQYTFLLTRGIDHNITRLKFLNHVVRCSRG